MLWFDGLEETHFCLFNRVFWTVEKNNQCLGTVHGFSMLLMSFCVLDNDILHGRKIIFGDVKLTQSEQQIKFNGMPFVVLECKNMDFYTW